MPEWIAASWLPLTLACLAFAIALLAVMVAVGARAKASHTEQALAKLGKELAGLRTGAVGMGQRIIAMEKSQSDRQSSPEADSANLRPYTEATHLLSLGLGKDEVASRCGLSRAEASLLDALRKKPD